MTGPAEDRTAENRENRLRIERLAERHAAFLRFLTSRVGDPAAAEDILQSAYIKALESGTTLREKESVVAWFYRILRNAVIDHYRRGAARAKAFNQFCAEAPVSYEIGLKEETCACVHEVIRDLKEEYREAIEHVDLAGKSIESLARLRNTTLNNASVRLHRARKAAAGKLTQVCGVCAEHKCLDCTCRRSRL